MTAETQRTSLDGSAAPLITSANRRTHRGSGVYVGRPSLLGNPYRIGRDGDRDQVIQLYRRWLWQQIQTRTAVYDELLRLALLAQQTGELTLICHCAPLQCHATVIKAAIAWMHEERRCHVTQRVPGQFYGIIITMYYRDHQPPHIHARYAEHKAEYAIADGARA